MESAPNNMPPSYYQDDEITLKELILKLREFSYELWNKKMWIILITCVIAALFLGKTYFDKTTYAAGISFMVTENSSTEQGLSSPYGSLEFGKIENNKITELARSGRIIHDVLLSKAVINNRKDYLANHLINVYGLHDRWNEEPLVEEYKSLHLKDFYFSRDSVALFAQKELRALSILQELVVGNNLTGGKGVAHVNFNDDTDIFRLNVVTLEENLSMGILGAIYEELRTFYIEETIGRPQRTYDLLSQQTDSLLSILNAKEYDLALSNDRNRGYTSSLPGLGIEKLRREVVTLTQEHTESLSNLKKIELLLSQETPKFQIIDRTFFPQVNAPSKAKALMSGGLVGGLLALIFILGRKIIRDAMAS